MNPELTIIVSTLNAGLGLKTSLNAILQQQTAPTFEVLVVSHWPFAEIESELPAWDRRFRFLCAGQKGASAARNLGLREAKGEIVLFLDDESWIDDRLFLKKHVDAHRRAPEAIGVGGWYRHKVDANAFELAYFVTNGWQVARARIDATRTTALASGNMSFKLLPLRSAFSFDERFDLGASNLSLMSQLNAAGQVLQYTDRLVIEHRPRIGPLGLIYRAVYQGYGQTRFLAAKNPGWKYAGANLTRARHLQDSKIKSTRALEFAFWIFDLSYSAGAYLAKTGAGTTHISGTQVARAVCSELIRRIRNLPFKRSVNGLFLSLRDQLSKN